MRGVDDRKCSRTRDCVQLAFGGEKVVDEMSSEKILLSAREGICPICQKERFGKVPRNPATPHSTLEEPLLLLLFVCVYASLHSLRMAMRVDKNGK